MDTIAKYLSSELSFFQITWARYFFTVFFTLPFMFFFFRKNLTWSTQPKLQIFRGLTLFFANVLFFLFYFYNFNGKSFNSCICSASNYYSLISFFLNEKVGFRRWSAVIIGFVGSLIVIRPGFIEFNLASIAALGTGFFYGIYLIITRKLHSSDSPLLTLLLTGVVGAVVASFFVPVVWINPTLNQWSLLALMGIFACLGHLFLILSLKYADASKLAPFGYFEIVTNVILGYYFFGDFPHYWTWVGLAIIVCSGIYISFMRERVGRSLQDRYILNVLL